MLFIPLLTTAYFYTQALPTSQSNFIHFRILQQHRQAAATGHPPAITPKSRQRSPTQRAGTVRPRNTQLRAYIDLTFATTRSPTLFSNPHLAMLSRTSSSCDVASSQSEHSLHTLSIHKLSSTATLTEEAPLPHREPNPFMRTIYPDYSNHNIAPEPPALPQPVLPSVSAAVEPGDRVAAFRAAGVANVGAVEYGGYVLSGRLRYRHFVVTCPPIKKIRVGDTLSLDNADGSPVAFVTITHVRGFEKNWVLFSFKRATDPLGVTSPWIPSTHMGDLAVSRDSCRLPILVYVSRIISIRRMPDTLDILLNKVVKLHVHTPACPNAAHTNLDRSV